MLGLDQHGKGETPSCAHPDKTSFVVLSGMNVLGVKVPGAAAAITPQRRGRGPELEACLTLQRVMLKNKAYFCKGHLDHKDFMCLKHKIPA